MLQVCEYRQSKVPTPLSSDFKKNGAEVGEGVYPPILPYATNPMQIMYTLRCKLLAWGWWGGGVETPQIPPSLISPFF